VTAPAATFTDRIREGVARGKVFLPPLPEMLLKLREALQDERSDVHRVAGLLKHDPASSTLAIRMANSAAYGGLKPVENLEAAIGRLGLRRIHSLVTTLLHRANFEAPRPERRALFAALWDHAVATAVGARALTQRAGRGDREEAFLAGLLHDCGSLLVLKGLDWLEAHDRSSPVPEPVVEELFDVLAPDLGAKTLEGWGMPEAVCETARRCRDTQVGGLSELALRVQFAAAIARRMGFHPRPDPALSLASVPAQERLRVGDVELAAVMVDVEDAVAELKRAL
jgi:HD-like signal output (HDOD) protein